MSLGQSIGSSLGRAIGSSLAAGGGYASLVTNGVLAPYVTFTRASSGTYYDSAGVLQTALTDVPRIDYDPSTLALRGLLIEEARTNLLNYSADFSNAAWTKSRCSITANAVVAPDGTMTADKIVEDTTVTSSHRIYQLRSKAASAITYTYSVFVKAAERYRAQLLLGDATESDRCSCVFNLSTGTASAPVEFGFTAASATITPAADGWYRLTLTGTSDTETTVTAMLFLADGAGNTGYTGNGTSSLYAWGAQLEAGAFATSYIPTTSAAVPRAADDGVLNTLSTIGYTTAEGTIYAEFAVEWDTTTITRYISTIDAVGRHIYSSGTLTWASYDGVNLLTGPAGLGSGGINRTASTWGGATKAIATNGAAAVSGAFDGTMGAGSSLGVGNNGGSGILCGHIKALRYYPRRLTNAELQALTA